MSSDLLSIREIFWCKQEQRKPSAEKQPMLTGNSQTSALYGSPMGEKVKALYAVFLDTPTLIEEQPLNQHDSNDRRS